VLGQSLPGEQHGVWEARGSPRRVPGPADPQEGPRRRPEVHVACRRKVLYGPGGHHHHELRAQNPELRDQSPEARAQSPELRAQSPEARVQSSEPRAQSSEPRAQSSEPFFFHFQFSIPLSSARGSPSPLRYPYVYTSLREGHIRRGRGWLSLVFVSLVVAACLLCLLASCLLCLLASYLLCLLCSLAYLVCCVCLHLVCLCFA